MKKVINEFRGEHRFLSNFWSCYINWEGIYYPSVENAYQALKMADIDDRKRFRHIKASEAKQLGKLLPMVNDWDKHKVAVMYELLLVKFDDPMLKRFLKNTAPAILEEGNWWGDTYWGTVNGKGDNHLGKLLMRVRDE